MRIQLYARHLHLRSVTQAIIFADRLSRSSSSRGSQRAVSRCTSSPGPPRQAASADPLAVHAYKDTDMNADKGASEDVDKVACEDVDKEGLAVARGASATSRSETSGASSTTSAVFHSSSLHPSHPHTARTSRPGSSSHRGSSLEPPLENEWEEEDAATAVGGEENEAAAAAGNDGDAERWLYQRADAPAWAVEEASDLFETLLENREMLCSRSHSSHPRAMTPRTDSQEYSPSATYKDIYKDLDSQDNSPSATSLMPSSRLGGSGDLSGHQNKHMVLKRGPTRSYSANAASRALSAEEVIEDLESHGGLVRVVCAWVSR